MTTDHSDSGREPGHCELVKELSQGRLGSLWLGRTRGGIDPGRFVLLRQLPAASSESMVAALGVASAISHPRLLPVLGVATVAGREYLISEYVEGIPLHALLHSRAMVVPEVALRIGLDLTTAVFAARQELYPWRARCVYWDGVWLARFGEVLLMEAGVAHAISFSSEGPAVRGNGIAADEGASDEVSDVLSLLALLRELLSGTDFLSREATASRSRASRRLAQILDSQARTQKAEVVRVVDLLAILKSLPPSFVARASEVAATVTMALATRVPTAAQLEQDDDQGDDPWNVPTRSMTMPIGARVADPVAVTTRPLSPLRRKGS